MRVQQLRRLVAVAPRRIQLHAGNPNTVPLGPLWSHCRFQLEREGRLSPRDLAQALCQLQIVPQGEHWMAWSMAEELAIRIHDFLSAL